MGKTPRKNRKEGDVGEKLKQPQKERATHNNSKEQNKSTEKHSDSIEIEGKDTRGKKQDMLEKKEDYKLNTPQEKTWK